jgi:hypothetical protein
MKNSGNELNEVTENKGHNFFKGCTFRAFCVQITPLLVLKGAKNAAFCKNQLRLENP